jgi:hypothetical protein
LRASIEGDRGETEEREREKERESDVQLPSASALPALLLTAPALPLTAKCFESCWS